MKHIAAAALAAILLVLCGCTPKETSAEFYAMDTVMSVTVYGNGGGDILTEVSSLLNAMERRLSRTLEGSEVSALNAAAGTAMTVSADTAALLEQAGEYARATGGAFDISVAPVVSAWGFTADAHRIPSNEELSELLTLVDHTAVAVNGTSVSLDAGQSIDLGGIAKGHAAACLAELFDTHGVEHAIAALGGNVYARGTKPDGSPWRIGVQDPADFSAYAGILSVTDAFAVTSGAYQRYFEQDGKFYHHIIDPADGYPADSGLASVTVVASAANPKHGAMCDAFSTALFVMGEEQAVEFWRGSGYDFDMILITEDGRLLATAGLESAFQPTEGGYAYEIIR